MPSTRSVAFSSFFAVASALIVIVGLRCAREPKPTFDELVLRGRSIGLTAVEATKPEPELVFLVADPTKFTEPVILNVPGQDRTGWVRVRRVTPGTQVAAVPGQEVYGDCELIGDPELIRRLLER